VSATSAERVETTSLLIHAVGLTKRYGSNVALKPTDFDLAAGECVGIIGENGAGKSTLAKLLTGAVSPNAGRLEVMGAPATFSSPRDALAAGIALIPQELAYVPALSVAENIMLNRLPSRRGVTSRVAIAREARGVMERAGLHVDPARQMSDLRLADQQIVEILKALARASRVLILDEPTAALTEDESAQLFAVLREQRDRGIGVIVISHHLQEINKHADRIDVFRNGSLVFSAAPSDAPPAAFVEQMLGSTIDLAGGRHEDRTDGKTILSLTQWEATGIPGLRRVDVDVREKEVLGVYGIRGSGSELLADGMGGRRPDISGSITIQGRRHAIFSSPRAAIAAGVAYVPADRKRDGLVLQLSIRRAIGLLILRKLCSFGVVSRKKELQVSRLWAQRIRLTATSHDQPVGELSGGNQQKVLLAGRLATEPAVLVAHQPTRGVDIAARREIHAALRELSDAGKAVLVITSDVEEAVEVSDRLLIVRDGSIIAQLVGTDISEDRAVHLAGA
jgi:ABC-type sugar transport system ATPase subunit